MLSKKAKAKLYIIAVRWRLMLYVIAALIVIIPIIIVLITDRGFSSFYSNIFVNTSIGLLIMGKILSAFKKYIDTEGIPWGSIGAIIGIFILLILQIIGLLV